MRANALAAGTSLRIAPTPVVMALVLAGGADGAATAVFCVAAATDWIDGRLARRWGVTSTFGTFLDTTADKLLVTGALIALVSVGRVSPWIAAIIIGRELLVMGLRGTLAAEEGTVLAPSFAGKAKAAVQFVAIALAILRPDVVIAGAYLDEWAMIAAAAITVASGAGYFTRARP